MSILAHADHRPCFVGSPPPAGSFAHLLPTHSPTHLRGHIEHFMGMTQVPTGLVGPLRVNGRYAQGDFSVPMATTEGGLVASYARGAAVCRRAGGASVICLEEQVQRCPLFRFQTLGQVVGFLDFVQQNLDLLRRKVAEVSHHARLLDLVPSVEGNQVILSFEYQTGDAAGQNMVTRCTEHLCQWLVAQAPVPPAYWYIESNFSGDKKATFAAFQRTRGKRVSAEILLPGDLISRMLRVAPAGIERYYQQATLAAMQSGAIGINGHYANGLAAIFLACGQDVACVAEAAVGITRFEALPDGNLYAAVTLPNLIVGTVGGGAGLPTQAQCLALMDCVGAGQANKFAEICTAALLAGELSIIAALAGGYFARAHQVMGRRPTSASILA